MKAILHARYGSPGLLRFEEVARPAPRDKEVLIKVKSGDRVFGSAGMAGGGHAQYACLHENAALAIMPDSLSWEDAAAIPFGANTALHYLRNLGKIQDGHKLLIVGASGSIGSAAVQLGKHFGAAVTAVCSGANVELVKSLGAGTRSGWLSLRSLRPLESSSRSSTVLILWSRSRKLLSMLSEGTRREMWRLPWSTRR